MVEMEVSLFYKKVLDAEFYQPGAPFWKQSWELLFMEWVDSILFVVLIIMSKLQNNVAITCTFHDMTDREFVTDPTGRIFAHYQRAEGIRCCGALRWAVSMKYERIVYCPACAAILEKVPRYTWTPHRHARENIADNFDGIQGLVESAKPEYIRLKQMTGPE